MDDQPEVGEVDISALTVEEAKERITWLRHQKSGLALQRKELTAQKADENARWRERQAGRLRGMKRGGLFGTMVQASRRGEAMEHAERINRIVARHQDIDEDVREIDREIREIEAHIRAQPKPPRASVARAPIAPPLSAPDPAASLASLKSMLDAGHISAEEYEGKKAEILGRL